MGRRGCVATRGLRPCKANAGYAASDYALAFAKLPATNLRSYPKYVPQPLDNFYCRSTLRAHASTCKHK